MKTKNETTHSYCINRAAIWLSNQKSTSHYRCKIILTEMVGYGNGLWGSEIPDVLGIWTSKSLVNIECKVSRSDFLKDIKKRHEHPYGNYKFYACPSGLINREEIPEHFGLLYLAGNGVKLIKPPVYTENGGDATSMLCDIIINGVTGGSLNETHKKRNRQWDGKAIIL
ncbi:MAG: hypothetical protein ACYDDE_03895 [bacterium]